VKIKERFSYLLSIIIVCVCVCVCVSITLHQKQLVFLWLFSFQVKIVTFETFEQIIKKGYNQIFLLSPVAVFIVLSSDSKLIMGQFYDSLKPDLFLLLLQGRNSTALHIQIDIHKRKEVRISIIDHVLF